MNLRQVPAFKRRKKIHEQLDRLAAELHDELQLTMGDAEARIASSLEKGDSLFALQLARVESELDVLDLRFHDWESTVVPLPGATCDHDHDSRPRITTMLTTTRMIMITALAPRWKE